MPGTLAIDAANTFAAALLMSAGPKPKFGSTTGEISVNAAGIPQYQAEVAVTYLAEPGRRPVSEVITVTITAPSDPTKDLAPGSPVMFDGLRAGVSQPEARDNGKGIRGGRMWFSASGIRSAVAAGQRNGRGEG
jgi:hypothetical protein